MLFRLAFAETLQPLEPSERLNGGNFKELGISADHPIQEVAFGRCIARWMSLGDPFRQRASQFGRGILPLEKGQSLSRPVQRDGTRARFWGA
jgi:hypothetical protein